MKEQKELEKARAQDKWEIKALKKELKRKEKAMAEMAACWGCEKSGRPSARRTRKAVTGDGVGRDRRKGSPGSVLHRLSEEEHVSESC